jgi:hypothetical protein
MACDTLRAGGFGVLTTVGARFSASVQTDRESHPASYKIDTGSFPGVKGPGRGVVHPPHLTPRLKDEYSYSSTPPFVVMASDIANFTIYF